ncbi:hypothetical protein CMO89_02005 [Candidatus Woesearchaeota archaeon]|nr:hypothetical protein [Candidatus Woesearchaeota archaeon]|tara:strand:+ start:12409 stop:12642 length:234 start_codon:yes stop_codon:yes gene_type:complete
MKEPEPRFGDLFKEYVCVFNGFPFSLTGGEYVLMYSSLSAPCLEQRCDRHFNDSKGCSAVNDKNISKGVKRQGWYRK